MDAAASARLCVETWAVGRKLNIDPAAASARLCVETREYKEMLRLADKAAASARLCVETFLQLHTRLRQLQPPPRGCVLKHFN